MSDKKNFAEGALFKNNRKVTETDYDYSGEITIDGQTRWLNAWINTSAKGEKYMKVVVGNLKVPKEQKVTPSVTPVTSNVTTETSSDTPVDDQIPF